MKSQVRVCVTGGAGFIGHHLVHYLRKRGYWVRAIDVVAPQWSTGKADESWWSCDLRVRDSATRAMQGCCEIYALAATMGGAGFVFTGEHDREIMYDNTLINLNTLEAARLAGVDRYLFSSSACCYPEGLQREVDSNPLKEQDAYPAGPDSEYGWEKLYTERLCQTYARATKMEIRIARFHNIYGPETNWNDGREKAPAAMCRKAAEAKYKGHGRIEVWGDGKATRSFCYIDDCTEMIYRLMHSDYRGPMNIGTSHVVSIDKLAIIAARCAGFEPKLIHVPGPQGVRGRNADLSLMQQVLGYEPRVSLEDGMQRTYNWIEGQVKKALHV